MNNNDMIHTNRLVLICRDGNWVILLRHTRWPSTEAKQFSLDLCISWYKLQAIHPDNAQVTNRPSNMEDCS